MSLLQIIGNVHAGSGIRGKTGALLESAKSWLIALALWLGFGTAMHTLRRIFKEVVERNLEFREGPPPRNRQNIRLRERPVIAPLM